MTRPAGDKNFVIGFYPHGALSNLTTASFVTSLTLVMFRS
jgi:hypothetical protein